MATVFQVLGIDTKLQFLTQAGRPVYMVEDGKPIAELISGSATSHSCSP